VNPLEHPVFRFLQKRFTVWEIFLGALTLGLFYSVAALKGSELSMVAVVTLGVLVMCILYPRGSLYVLIALVYAESFFGGLNQVATVAKQFEIAGFEKAAQSAFFYMVFPGIIFLAVLGYAISRFLSNPAPFGMLTTEYIMLVPPLLCLTFAPLSFILDHPRLAIVADSLPGLFFILGIIIARVFFPVKGFFFLMLNALCIGNHIMGLGFLIFTLASGLLVQNLVFVVWVGRILMGPTDFNIFLVPILLAVLIYCGKDIPRGWRIFYGFSLWAFFLRLIFSLFRGPIAATLLAFVVIYFLFPPIKRLEMRRYFLRMAAITFICILLFIWIVPFGGMVLKGIFVERFTGMFRQGEKYESAKLSLEFRAAETQVAMGEIMDYPIIGHGPGAEIAFRFVANMDAEKRAYIHNGYLWLWHKFGIAGPISIVLFLLTPFVRGLQLRRKKLTDVESAFLIGVMASTICIFPAIVTNSIIARGQGLVMLVMCFAILLTIERRVLRDEGMDINPYL
jgi:O-antigen ligase